MLGAVSIALALKVQMFHDHNFTNRNNICNQLNDKFSDIIYIDQFSRPIPLYRALVTEHVACYPYRAFHSYVSFPVQIQDIFEQYF